MRDERGGGRWLEEKSERGGMMMVVMMIGSIWSIVDLASNTF